MRSRYSAYILLLEDYVLATWHSSTRPASLGLADAEAMRWLGLEIRSKQETTYNARVEFIARYRIGSGPVQQQHEISRFVRERDRWYYLDGEFPRTASSFAQVREAWSGNSAK
jgi:SEC-C motif-containing protein